MGVRQTIQNDRQLQLLMNVASPVFYSTDARGVIERGLGNIPEGRPILFVGNHQTFAPDLSIIITQFLQEKGTLLRGLAHPAVVAGAAPDRQVRRNRSGGAGGPALWNRFASFGAVPVSPFAMYNLLSLGEAVLLFPGGAREACKGRGEEYQLLAAGWGVCSHGCQIWRDHCPLLRHRCRRVSLRRCQCRRATRAPCRRRLVARAPAGHSDSEKGNPRGVHGPPSGA